MSPPAEDEFRALYASHARAVLGYALRRTDSSDDAADVVAETFLVAWRRPGAVPVGAEARPWLFGVARRTLANLHRGRRRRDDLAQRLRRDLRAVLPDHADEVAGTADTTRLLSRLPAKDREILTLTAWEQLTPSEIAEALQMSPNAVRLRLSRARTKLREWSSPTDLERPAGALTPQEQS